MLRRKGIRVAPITHLENEKIRLPPWLPAWYSLLLGLFAFLHSVAHAGWRTTLYALVWIIVLSWVAERLGSTSGIPFGRYHYTPRLQPRLFGIPLPVLLCWFAFVYVSTGVAYYLFPNIPAHTKIFGHFVQGIVGALAMVNLDLVIDPTASVAGEWHWDTKGHYFGIPASNFAGWFLVALFIIIGCTAIYKWPSPHQAKAMLYENLAIYVLIVLQATIRSAVYGISKAALPSLFFILVLLVFAVVFH